MRNIIALFITLALAATGAIAEPVVTVSFVKFYDLNGNKSFDCGERFDYLVTFKDTNPQPNFGGYHGHLKAPVAPSQNFFYSFAPDSAQNCQILNVVTGNSRNDTQVDVEFSCAATSPVGLTLLVDDAYFGPTGPIFLEANAEVDEVATLQHHSISTPFYYFLLTGCPTSDLALTKTDGGISSAPGKVVPYTLTTSNLGQGAAAAAVLTETVPANTSFDPSASSPGWSCSPSTAAGSTCSLAIGNVASGGSIARIFAVDIGTNVPTGVTAITNTASVTSSTPDSNLSNNTATDTTPIAPGIPDLTVTKTTSSTGATPGSSVVWTLTAANTGNASAAAVVLNETLPAGTTFVPALSSTGWTCSASSCTNALGTLLAGTSVSRQFGVQVVSPAPQNLTSLQNTACASTTGPETNTTNNCGSTTTSVGGAPALQTQKFVVSGTGTPGTNVVWGITITNTGNRDAGAVTIAETVPPGTNFDAADSSSGWTCAPSAAAGSNCTLLLPSLPGAGGSLTRNFATSILNPLPAGQTSVANTTCASSSGSADACATVTIPTDGSPNLAIMKSLTSGDSSPGAVDLFTLTAQNTGNQSATNVVLTETVPDNTTFNTAASSPDWTCLATTPRSTCTLTLPSLAGVGGTASRIFAVTIDDPLPAGVTALTNTACIGLSPGALKARARGLRKATGGACDTISVTPKAAPVLSITKALSSGTVTAGQTIAYSLTVSNTGNQNATGVIVTDAVPQASTWTGGSPGWTCSPTNQAPSSCSLTLGTLNAGSTATLTILFQLDSPIAAGITTLSNTACANDGIRNACATVSDPVIPSGTPALSLKKTYTGPPLRPGALLSFGLHVTNSGTAQANDVRLVETVPAATLFAPASSSPGWTCASPDAGSSCTVDIGSLAAGATADATFAVTAPDPIPDNVRQIANTACVQDSSGRTVGCDQTSTPLDVGLALSLRDDLVTDLNHDGFLSQGDTLRYTLLVKNTSDQPATSAVITTALDSHLALIAGSVTTDTGSIATGNSQGDTSPKILIPTLAPGATATITFEVLGQDLTGLKQVASQSTAAGDNFENTLSDDPDTPQPLDPTVTPLIDARLPSVPTLGTVGLTALAITLAVAAFIALRRRPTP